MLQAGSSVPAVRVWTGPRDESELLSEVLGSGHSLLCFYVFDFSPT